MNKIEKIVAEAKALGETSVIAQIQDESEIDTLLAQAKALGIRGYAIRIENSELADIEKRGRNASNGKIIDLSPAELEKLASRAFKSTDDVKTESKQDAPVAQTNTNADTLSLYDQVQEVINKAKADLEAAIEKLGVTQVAVSILVDGTINGESIEDDVDVDEDDEDESDVEDSVESDKDELYATKPNGDRYYNRRDGTGRFMKL